MRYLVKVTWPHEPFNTYVREGTAGQRIGRVLEETNPESVYFTDTDGKRSALAVYRVNNPSDIPALCEPWFLSFNADIEIRIAMTPEDLKASGLEEIGKRWRS